MNTYEERRWFLEGFTDRSRQVWRTPISALPCTIGRSADCQLYLDSPSVSQQHAKIVRWRRGLRIVDLGSTNGTFLNGRRVDRARPLAVGDCLRVAEWEFRLVERGSFPTSAPTTEVLSTASLSPHGEVELERKLDEMVASRRYRAVFQPIVRLEDRSVFGYEALGRGVFDGVETPPDELFLIAERLDKAAELSELFRCEQLQDALDLPGDPQIFLNTHPAELKSPSLLARSLASQRDVFGSLPRLCIEIHETAAIGLGVLSGISENLAAMKVSVAFDDFGAGQSRLFELAETGPQYLKFDGVWIRDLDRASGARIDLITTLIRMVRDLGITPIAEGVERREEAAACSDIGFELAQGFHLGRPDRASSL